MSDATPDEAGERALEKAREKDELYALDISGATWLCPPGSEDAADRVEIAYLPGGAVALRNPADPHGTVLRYTPAEWEAFVLGVRDGEFD